MTIVLFLVRGLHDHVTGELEKLVVCDRYKGDYYIHTISGSDMKISHIGHSIVQIPSHDFVLKNIIYSPQGSKNLIFVHRLAYDNSTFLEFNPKFFMIDNQATRKLLLKGPCHRGLYPLLSSSSLSAIKQAFGAIRPSLKSCQSFRPYLQSNCGEDH
jgi:hypothetical protein